MLLRPWLADFLQRLIWKRRKRIRLRNRCRRHFDGRCFARHAEVLECRMLLSGPTAILGLSTGKVVDGSLTAPSEVDKYTFTLSHDSEVYFDSLTNNGNLNWSLSGPAGTAVSSRSFTASDGPNITNPVLDLVSGNYTLTVAASGNATGDYAFRLLDLGVAGPLTIGAPLSDTLADGDTTNAYQFTAIAGDAYSFSSVVTSGVGNDDWRLVDPYGYILASQSLTSDLGTFTFDASGMYTLLVEGQIGNTSDATYTVSAAFLGNTPPVVPSGTPLTLGATVNGTLATAGQQDTYTFTLASNSLLYFDSLTNDGNFNWSLSGPAGTAVSSRSFASSDGFNDPGNPVLNLVAGNYTLTVTASGNTGAYGFRLSNLADVTSLTPGTPASDTLNPGNSTNLYQFQATAGQSFYLANQVTSGSGYPNEWRLVDPYGTVVSTQYLGNDIGRVTLNTTGTYALLVEGYVYNTTPVGYTLTVDPVIDPAPQAMTLGSLVTATLQAPSEQDQYTFNLTSNSLLYFDSLTTDSNFNWSLSGPAGTVVSSRSFASSDGFNDPGNPVLNLVAGNYTLTVTSSGNNSGAYSFRLSNLADVTSLTPGTSVSDTLNPGNSTNLYQFQGTAGQSFYLANQVTSGSGYPNEWRLIDPYGNVVSTQYLGNDIGRVTLNATGMYALLVEGYVYNTAPVGYTLNVEPVVDPAPQAMTLGSLVTATLQAPSEQDQYTFNLASNALLYFDSLTTDSNFNWSLTGPAGTAVSSRSFAVSDGLSIGFSFNPVSSLVAGNYTLTVTSSGNDSGAYSFRLSNLANVTSLNPGTAVDGTLNAGNSTDLYQFQATAGQSFYLASSGGGYPNVWRLVDPYGNIVAATYLGTDLGRVTASTAGTYSILVEGYVYNTTPVSYTLNVDPVVDPAPQALTLGSLVTATLQSPSEQDAYTFTLASNSLLYFDSLTNDGNFNWSLTGPAGTAVSSRSFAASDGLSIGISGNPVLNLVAGNYTLTVTSSGNDSGAYSFRLSNLENVTSLTLNTPVSDTLSPGDSTNLYQFTAAAGDSYSFSGNSTNSGNDDWRLVDPYGNVLASQYLYADLGTLTLNASGTYTLLVEGNIGNTTNATYTINASFLGNTPVTPVGTPLTLGTTVSATLATAGEQDVYTFTLPSNALAYFDSLTNDANFNWSLSGPEGTVASDSFNRSDGRFVGNPVLNLVAGNYTLAVTANGSATGAYGFRLSNLAAVTSLSPGTLVSDTLNPGDSSNLYQFQATAGQSFYLANQVTSGSVGFDDWRLVDPYGNIVAAQALGADIGRVTLKSAGAYTVLVEGDIGNASSAGYTLNVVPVVDPAPQALTLGSLVAANLQSPGEQDVYTFSLASNALAYFDSLTKDANFNWSLSGPAGTVIASRSFLYSDGANISNPVLNLAAGNYTLTVSANGSATGAYSFRLSNLAAATSLSPSAAVNDTLNPGNSSNLYQFQGTAGESVYLANQLTSGSGYPNVWRLVDPYGNIIAAQALGADIGRVTLQSTGTYTVVVEGDIGNTSPVSDTLNVVPVVDPAPQVLALGSVVTANLQAPGEQDVYTFSLASNALAYFDSLTKDANFYWSLSGPAGTVVSSRSFIISDGVNISNPVLNLATGNYTLTVTANGSVAGAYSFRLSNLANVTSLSPGMPVSDTLNPGDSTNLYQFQGTAGQSFYLANELTSGSGYPNDWRLVDPYGNVIAAQALGADIGRVTLNSTGTYTVVVEGDIGSTSPASYGLDVIPVVDPTPTALTLTGPQTVSFTSPDTTTLAVGSPASFSVTTAGSPPATLTETGALPVGITFDPTSGLLSGTPVAGTGKTYIVAFTADNGDGPAVNQTFRLNVDEAPAISSAGNATFLSGIANSFQVITSGFPAATFTETGTLPAGVTFNQTTGVFSGDPAAATGGVYPVLLTANNSIGQPATQNFTLTVQDSPDLEVTNVAVSPASIVSSGQVTITWQDQNNGAADVTHDFTDSVLVQRMDGNATTIFSGAVAYSVSASGTIAAGQTSAQRQVAFALPNGYPGTGNFLVTITTDANNDIFENNPSGHASAEANNTTTANFISTLAPYPDLVVNNLVSPMEAWSGRSIAVSWTVANQGNATTSGTWTDNVYLVNDATMAEVYLGSVTSPIELAPGQSYTRTQDFLVPDGIGGNYHLVVVANSDNNLFELNTLNDSATGASFPVHLTPYADLQVSSVAVPDSASSGQPINVSWTVTNAGTGGTNASAWYDEVDLSTDPTFSQNVIQLGDAQNPSYLAPGESYSQSLSASLAAVVQSPISGQYYVRVTTDAFNDQYEYEFEKNNTRISTNPIDITVPPLETPFLHVTQESVAGAGATFFAGQTVTVNWNVMNTGTAAIPASRWDDGLALSQTPNWDGIHGYFLGSQIFYSGSLAVGGTYQHQATVALPQDISGTWYVVVIPDTHFTAGVQDAGGPGGGPVAGDGDTGHDQGSTPIQLQVPPSPDLQVESFTAPPNASTNQTVNLTWTVQNAGFGPTGVGSWQDAVYISASPTLQTRGADAGTLLGTFTHTGILDAVDSYTTTQSVVVPQNLASGPYYFFVDTNSDSAVFEHASGYDATANNTQSSPVSIQFVPPAQLAVTLVTAPSTAGSSQPIMVSWTVVNQGLQNTSPSLWSDSIVLSQDDDLSTTGDNTTLATVAHSGALTPGSAYTAATSVTLPDGISGTYHLFVVTDSANQVNQGSGEPNNVPSAAVSVSLTPPPRLEVSSITAGAVFTGQPLAVQWTVSNAGAGATPPSQTGWYDKLYLATVGATDPTTGLLLGTFAHNGALAAGASYSQSQFVLLPVDVPPGPYALFVVTDAGRQVFEIARGTSNVSSRAINVVLTPPPDLAVGSITAPASVYSGQPITVAWQVANQGTGPTVTGTWTDSVYLSTDQFLDTTRAIYLGSVTHNGDLDAGASYSSSLTATIPNSSSGPYYVFVVTDSGNKVFENGVKANNQSFAPQATVVSFAPLSDLAVSSITLPASGIAGQAPTAPVSWTVVNQGANPAVGTWSDAVYLSPTPTWDVSDPLLARVVHTGDIAPGDSYKASTSAFLPGVVPGNYYVIVRTDILNNVRESDETNNQSTSSATMSLDVPVLQSGQTTSGTIQAGQSLYYRVDTQAGQNVLLTANFPISSQARFYVRYGAPPTPSTYDSVYSTPADSQQLLTLASTRAGTYYIMLVGQTGDGSGQNFDITAQVLQFGITSVTPSPVGSSGQVTLTINGSQFSLDSQVSLLTTDGMQIGATQVWWISSTELKATFNLDGIALGNFTVQVTDHGQEASQPAALTTTSAPPGILKVTMSGPGTIFAVAGSTADVSAVFTNVGGSNLAPQISELTPVYTEFGTGALINGPTQLFLVPALAPGQSVSFSYAFTPPVPATDINVALVGPGESAGGAVEIEPPPPPTIDWAALKDQARPSYISPAAWNVIWNNFTSIVGSLLSTFQEVVAANSDYLEQLGDTSPSLDDLISFVLEQANDAFPTPFLASATDLADPAPGISLDFSRAFLQPISGRYTLGPLGLGWTDPWDESVSVDSQGNATILAAGAARQFVAQGNGTYVASPGDHGILTFAQGTFTLTETNGTVEQFNTAGQLAFVQDLSGNRVTAVYSGNLLTQLIHSNGDSLSFTYNAAGLITQVADSAGQTVTYAYDATNQHLLSVTNAQGTTTYTYVTGQGAASENSLASITNPDGTHTYFTYDGRGRLAGQSNDGGAQAVTYSYDSSAGVSVTDATGDTTRLLFDPNGNIAIFDDALGNSTRLEYDGNNNLTNIVEANGAKYSYRYDTSGNLLQSVDPLGNETDMTYTPSLNQLATLRDAAGNTTRYAYDSQGNLSLVVNADGSTTTAAYNAQGLPTTTTDARGQTIGYQYNAAGQVTLEAFADGTQATFNYDAFGNLLSTTDATGTTTYTYNAANEVTSVAYPTGQTLLYSYDAGGRRSQIVDETSAYTVNYNYDAAGRLSTLTDASGAILVTYHYDADGRLAEQDNANGTYTTYAYDAGSNLLHLINYGPGAVIQSRFDYTYDALNERTGEGTLDGTWTYTYDADGQLIHAVFASTNPAIANQDLTYVYDAAGNRIRTIINGITTPYMTNNRNEYTTVGGTTYQYDADGNMISQTDASGTTTFTYNSLNQLTQIVTPTDTWTYQYNALGERVAATHNGQKITYVLDPAGLGNVIAAYDSTGHLVANYAYGLGLVSQTSPNSTSYYQFDAIGSTTGMTDSSGIVTNRYSYLPYGGILASKQSSSNPSQYVGSLGVVSDGANFGFMHERFYSSDIGRFLTPDPLGIAQPTLYAYALNQPTNLTDATGLLIPAEITVPLYFTIAITQKAITNAISNVYWTRILPFVVKYSSEIEWLYNFGIGKLPTGLDFLKIPGVSSRLLTRLNPWVTLGQLLYFEYTLLKDNGKKANEIADSLSDFLLKIPSVARLFGVVHVGVTFPSTLDPNDIIGPAGAGDQGFVAPAVRLPYRIDFENLPTATASVRTLTVTDHLDPSLDPRTLQLGDIGFDNHVISVPAGLSFFSTIVDLRPDGQNLLVAITALLDPTTATITWTFNAIDPSTGVMPANPLNGILPPNDDENSGEGYVTYSVRPKASDPTGTVIAGQATVIFDTNPPIDTGIVTNTIDAAGPTSAVAALPAFETAPSFTVNWSGSDDAGGSGIASYDVFVSDDGGAYTQFLAGTTDTSALFTGQLGHTYAFFSVATDNVGNVEAAHLVPDTTTTVVSPLTAGTLTPPSATEGQAFGPVTVFHFSDGDPNAVAGDFVATVQTGDATLTNAADPASVQIVANAGGGFDVQLAYTYAEELSNQTFGVSVTDNTSTVSASTSTFSVADAALTAGTLTPPTATEGQAFGPVTVFHFTDADPNGAAGDYVATVHTGDATLTSAANPTSVQVVANARGGFDVQLAYTYAEELSNQTFSVSVSDVGGAAAISATTSVGAFSVADAALTAGTFTPPTAIAGQAFNFVTVFHFTDVDPKGAAGDYLATVHTGDGTTLTSAANPTSVQVVANAGGGFDVQLAYTYSQAPVNQTFSVSVTDQSATASASTSTFSVAPGPVSLAKSVVSLSSSSVASGSGVTVTLQAEDAFGNKETTGGLTVAFGLGSSSGGQGTFGTVTDHHNGTYTATFTGTTAGSNTITGTIGGQAVASTAPSITVTPGPVSLAKSIVSLAFPGVTSGGTDKITLQAEDAAGNKLTTGGSTVVFSLGSTTGGQGTFSAVTDHNNGTYTVTFTGTTAGSNTIKATIGGQAVSSTAPAITITAAASLSRSAVSLSSASVASGSTVTVTLQAKDASGNNLTAGGLTVKFSLGSTTGGQGTFSAVTDHHNGKYTVTFTGTTAGANTLKATIGGKAVTSTAPAITVTPGPVSLVKSIVSLSSASVASGSGVTVTLQAEDAAGNKLTAGGLTVAFARGSTSGGQGTFSAVTDNRNGTYTATFTATKAGSNTITATIGGQAVTSTAPSITVTPGPVSLAKSFVSLAFPGVASGGTEKITLHAEDAAGNKLTTGGLTVVFSLGSTSGGQGTFSTVTDNHNGTYTVTFTGTTAGANTIKATIGGTAVTSTAPAITITAAASLSRSIVSLSSASVASGSSVTITLQTKDANGNNLTAGGLAVLFALGSASGGQGTFGTVTDNHNGTYTVTFTGTTAGANTIKATIGGKAVTSTAPSITVTG